MAVTKRIQGSYTLTSINPTDQITFNTSTVTINGNLIVMGNTQQIEVTNSVFANNFITISSVAGINSGIMVDRSNNPASNVSLIWNDTVMAWQTTTNGITYANVATMAAGVTGSALTAVAQDANPTLGGNLDIDQHSIYSSVNGLQVYTASTPGGGGTGLLVTNSQYANVEIMSETKGIVYSIIFG